MKKYVVKEKTLTDIADAIRGSVFEETDKFTPEQMPEKIADAIVIHRESAYQMGASENYEYAFEKGRVQGEQDAYNTFWDKYQNYGKRTDNRHFCSYYNFTEETFKPKYPIMLSSYGFDTCQLNISLIEKGVRFEAPVYASTSLGYCFRNTKLTEIPTVDVSKGNTLSSAFTGSTLLKKIEKIISSRQTSYTGAFSYCNSLEEIRFEGEIGADIDFSSCPLTKQSILSVITHLYDDSQSKTLTLKSSSVNNIDWGNTVVGEMIYNTFDEICDLQPNWTISLV